MLIFLLGTHLYLTFKTRFIQKKIFLGIKLSAKHDKECEGDISPFGSLAIAMAATVGTGNIIGVGTAIALGGPGAVLWMWFTGVFGIATKYAESLIAVKYRVKTKKGAMLGGAMYVLERGLNLKFLGILFALFGSIASFGIGSSVQSNVVATVLNESFNIPMMVSAIGISVILSLIVLGGLKSISDFCINFVPFMAFLYIVGCISILVINKSYVLPALSEIITSAFSPRAAGGGFIGASIMIAARHGMARGLFSNESGMGSAPIVASAAKTRNSVRQALISSTGTFWSTVVICAITGIVLVSSIMAHPNAVKLNSINGAILAHIAFGQIKYIGPIILTFGLITFAFTTALGWSYYGERCVEYLFGAKSNIPYRIIYISTAFLGVVMPLGVVWNLADIFNALMAIPNLIAVLLLSGLVAKETDYYLYDDNLDKFDETPIPTLFSSSALEDIEDDDDDNGDVVEPV
jgi:AGCS family alanine or glycine:cation symporter